MALLRQRRIIAIVMCIAAIGASQSGCGTYSNLYGGGPYELSGKRVVFGGSRLAGSEAATKTGELIHGTLCLPFAVPLSLLGPIGIHGQFYWVRVYASSAVRAVGATADLPLCVVADTLTLPLVIGQPGRLKGPDGASDSTVVPGEDTPYHTWQER